MGDWLKISRALISVYHKHSLTPLVNELIKHEVEIWSTGGTARYLKELGAQVKDVEEITGYPSILHGRVKTLHPAIHGGILARRDEVADQKEMYQYDIQAIDLVMVDLYPFEDTVADKATEEEIIEKIDIGGIALIRAAAKNFKYVACIPSSQYYHSVAHLLNEQQGKISLAQRKELASAAFDVSSHYDTQIHNYLSVETSSAKRSYRPVSVLRYGENPHQEGKFYGNLDKYLKQLNGKPLSYNNLVDIDAAIELVNEFTDPVFAIIKHTNPCGCASGKNMKEAWMRSLASDPVSAFGGVLCCNGTVDMEVAKEINQQVYDVLIARSYADDALLELTKKKKRIILQYTGEPFEDTIGKEVLGGFLVQDRDRLGPKRENWQVKTSNLPSESEWRDMMFADRVSKHLKSNAIAIVKDEQLIGSGVGQTSRISAIRQAIEKAKRYDFELEGSILFSDAFFPFADSVEYAYEHGIKAIIQPGGSIRDKESVDFCEKHDMCLVFTGIRRFKH